MQQLQNFGTTTLNGAINSSVTSVVVSDGSVLPASGDYYILVESEIMLVTARSSNTLTVTRGQDGTAAASHADASSVKLTLNKAAIENYFGERIQVGGYASRPSTARAGWRYYANDIDLAWEYDGGNWNLFHPIYVPYAKRVDLTGWTGANISTSTWTDYNGVLVATAIPIGGTDQHRFYHKNLPSAPYKLNLVIESPSISSQYTGCGLGLHSTGDGRLRTMINFKDNLGQNISVDRYTNSTTFNSTQRRLQHWTSRIWLQIEDDNTNWYFRFSFNGKTYMESFSETRNTFLTPDKVCITIDRTHNTYTTNEYYRFLSYWEE